MNVVRALAPREAWALTAEDLQWYVGAISRHGLMWSTEQRTWVSAPNRADTEWGGPAEDNERAARILDALDPELGGWNDDMMSGVTVDG